MLQSLQIPCEILQGEQGFLLVVPSQFEERARFEIWQYEEENRPPKIMPPRIEPVHQNGLNGVVGYVVVISLVAVLAGDAAFNRDWFAAGRVDGELIRAGEWWRSITALTLHSGLRHFVGNLGFGVFFGMLAGRLLGSGVTWLAVVIASGCANLLNTLLLDSSHRSIGASTAVFAALGLVAGFVWRARVMRQDRWAYRIGPLVGGLALLAYTGTGDANTDIGAHLAGFVCGFVAGTVLTMAYPFVTSRSVQRWAGMAAIAIIALAWIIAL